MGDGDVRNGAWRSEHRKQISEEEGELGHRREAARLRTLALGSALILVVGDLGPSLYSLVLSLTLASRKHSSVLSTGSACLDVPEFLSFSALIYMPKWKILP